MKKIIITDEYIQSNLTHKLYEYCVKAKNLPPKHQKYADKIKESLLVKINQRD